MLKLTSLLIVVLSIVAPLNAFNGTAGSNQHATSSNTSQSRQTRQGWESEADALHRQGEAYAKEGDTEKAASYYQRALKIYKEQGARKSVAGTLLRLALLFKAAEQWEQATDYFRQLVPLAADLGDARQEREVFGGLCRAYGKLSQPAEAIPFCERALKTALSLNSELIAAGIRDDFGRAEHALARYEQAIGHFVAALATVRKLKHVRGELIILADLAEAYRAHGRLAEAAGHYEQALTIARSLGDAEKEAQTLVPLAQLYDDLKRYDKAAETYERILSVATDKLTPYSLAALYYNLASGQVKLGRYDPAFGYYRKALGDMLKLKELDAVALTVQALNRAGRATKRYVELIEIYEEALAAARGQGSAEAESLLLGYIGWAYDQMGRHAPAREYFAQGLARARALMPSAATGVPMSSENPLLTVQLGHSDRVLTSVMSADNRHILSGGSDNTVRIWSTAGGREIGQFVEPAAVNSLALSPDGRYVAVAYGHQTEGGRIWRPGVRASVMYIGDTRTLGIPDNGAHIWDLFTGKEVRFFLGHLYMVTAVAFSPDGATLLTGSADATARLWNVSTGETLLRFEGHEGSVTSVAFSPDGKTVLTGSEDRTACLWDAATGARIRCLQHPTEVRRVAFTPDGGALLLTGDHTESHFNDSKHVVDSAHVACRWPRAEGVPPRCFDRRSSLEGEIVFSPDGSRVLMAVEEDVARLQEVSSGKELMRFKGDEAGTPPVGFSPDGRFLLMGGNDGTVKVWDAATGAQTLRLQGFSRSISSAAIAKDLRYILTGGGDGASLWDTGSGKMVRLIRGTEVLGDRGSVVSTAFSPDQRFFVAGTSDAVGVWDVATGEEARLFHGGAAKLGAIAFTDDGRFVLTKAEGATGVKMLDARTGREVVSVAPELLKNVPAKGLSSDGQFAVFNCPGRALICMLDIRKQKLLWRRTGNITAGAVAFSPDARYVLTGGSDPGDDLSAHLLDARTGDEVQTYRGHISEILSVAFSPDGRLVVTGGNDFTARVWDRATGQEVSRLSGHTAALNFVAFASNGRHIVTAGNDSTLRLWTPAGKELCRLVSFSDGTWVVTDPFGRFDTNNLEGIKGLHWQMPDDLLSPLPVEIFMRQYYEPQLLPRILAGEKLADVPPLGGLNRAQPGVRITDISPQATSPDRVSVTVEVMQGRKQVWRDGRSVEMLSGVYDLRLFRNGQLVRYAPADGAEIKVGAADGKARVVFKDIKLPRVAGLREVEFAAYAFNTDRVKSETHRKSFAVPAGLEPRKGRVYLINVGINLYESPGVQKLLFSANDARSLRDALTVRLRQTGEYAAVIPVSLIADYEERGDEPVIRPTKENIRTIFDLLSGRRVDERQLEAIPAKLRGELRAVEPHDVVLISFSTHGEADGKGNFYLYPYDTGKLSGAELLKHSISNEELSLWLRDIDAREIVMILDTCYAGAAPGADFKPGPMGSRGLGQLAYDKGMRILAATQADNVALGSGRKPERPADDGARARWARQGRGCGRRARHYEGLARIRRQARPCALRRGGVRGGGARAAQGSAGHPLRLLQRKARVDSV